MALLPILRFPDPRLRTVAKPVEKVDDALKGLIDDMFETMYDEPGIGLAATQVDRHIANLLQLLLGKAIVLGLPVKEITLILSEPGKTGHRRSVRGVSAPVLL